MMKIETAPMLFERYRNDIQFRSMVQQFLNFMITQKVQPYEVRDAAFVAETLYREQFVKPVPFHYEPINEEK